MGMKYTLNSRTADHAIAYTYANNWAQARANFDDRLGLRGAANPVYSAEASESPIDGSVVCLRVRGISRGTVLRQP